MLAKFKNLNVVFSGFFLDAFSFSELKKSLFIVYGYMSPYVLCVYAHVGMLTIQVHMEATG